ncbi:MAG: hypothetical protein KatS3mg014_2539 [Actinomycetota bacterium]|nr:MAG: hypothetical protein KatS3mg014_2466 [Actinomycetota bacterium]GIV00924.1 MAG: hypothetical protein KatS3mg014_2539 [Actinomycetota bacterium]
MRIAYRGNFQPGVNDPWSTETEIALALADLGHDVLRCQEDAVDWERQLAVARSCDLFIWTRTASLDVHPGAREALATMPCPSVGLHLDRWWSLDREDAIRTEPYFACTVMATADGDAPWESFGIRHVWFPPAVGARHCWLAPRSVSTPALFVGSWRRYHRQWIEERRRLVREVSRLGGEVIEGGCRNACLNHAVARAEVTFGDSCQASSSKRYFSDRPFEMVGRGALLAQRRVEALTEMLEPGVHCLYWEDVAEVAGVLDWVRRNPEKAERIRLAGFEHVRRHHTYQRRLEGLLEELRCSIPGF